MRSESNRALPVQLAPLAVLVVVALLPAIAGGEYRLGQYDTVCIDATAALGLALSFGLAGQLVLAQPAIMGLAAYCSGLLSVHFQLGSDVTVWPALVVAVVANILISAPGLRVRGWYLGVISFFAVAVFPSLIDTAPSLTGADDGLVGIRPLIGGSYTWKPVFQFELLLGLLLVVTAVMWRLHRSDVGIVMRAVRDGPGTLAPACGVDVARCKIVVAALSAVPAGLAGWETAHVGQVIAPSSFNTSLLLVLVGAVMLGGRTSILGPIVGAIVFGSLSLFLFSFSVYNSLALGVGVLLVAVAFPEGIVPVVLRRLESRPPLAPVLVDGPPAEKPVGPDPKRTEGGPALSVTHVHKSFGGNVAIDDATFEVPRATICGLVGPNGSGKTTLLNVITGYVNPDEGSVRLDGRDITALRPRARVLLGIQRTFQVAQVVPDISVEDNLRLALIGPRRWRTLGGLVASPRYRAARSNQDAALERAYRLFPSLAQLRHQLAARLPLASRRILEVARVAVTAPVLAIFDEPAAGLAGAELATLGAALRSLAGAGTTVILVEHDRAFVREVADMEVEMRQGVAVLAASVPTPARPVAAVASRRAMATSCVEPSCLTVGHLDAFHGAAQVLRDVSLDVPRNAIVGIVGENGAGKSTLLLSIARLHRQTSGVITFSGTSIQKLRPVQVANLGLLLVREGARVFEDITVAEHLSLASDLAVKRKRQPMTTEGLFPALDARQNVLGGLLSGGQRQMLALRCALTADPECLLLDEPSAGLSEEICAEVYRVVRDLAGRGTTMVIVEQSAKWLDGLADRVVVLDRGAVTGA